MNRVICIVYEIHESMILFQATVSMARMHATYIFLDSAILPKITVYAYMKLVCSEVPHSYQPTQKIQTISFLRFL